MKNQILTIILIICLTFIVSGCAECISTEYENVEVTIVDEYYHGSYYTPLKVDKVTTMLYHPAVYRVTVEYSGVKYTINGEDTYNRYKDKKGQVSNGVLEIKTYDDGSIRYDIIKLE